MRSVSYMIEETVLQRLIEVMLVLTSRQLPGSVYAISMCERKRKKQNVSFSCAYEHDEGC